MIVGHVMRTPVEETVLQFVFAGAVCVTALAIGGRVLLQRLRRR